MSCLPGEWGDLCRKEQFILRRGIIQVKSTLFPVTEMLFIPSEEFNYIYGATGLQERHGDLHAYPERKCVHHHTHMDGTSGIGGDDE